MRVDWVQLHTCWGHRSLEYHSRHYSYWVSLMPLDLLRVWVQLHSCWGYFSLKHHSLHTVFKYIVYLSRFTLHYRRFIICSWRSLQLTFHMFSYNNRINTSTMCGCSIWLWDICAHLILCLGLYPYRSFCVLFYPVGEYLK